MINGIHTWYKRMETLSGITTIIWDWDMTMEEDRVEHRLSKAKDVSISLTFCKINKQIYAYIKSFLK